MNKRTISTIAFCAVLLGGCEKQAPPPPPNPEIAHVKVVAPASTEYVGEGKIVYRKVDSIRILSPFGVSPGEVISAQKPTQVTEGPTPGINISPVGVASTSNGGGTWSSGGFKRTLWDRIVSFFNNLKWFLIIGAVAGIGLYLWPVSRPIMVAIGRIFGAIIPVVGSAIEWLIGRFKTKTATAHFTETVDGVQNAKDAVEAWVDRCVDIPAEKKIAAKTELRKLINDALAAKQDTGTQVAVADAKKPV